MPFLLINYKVFVVKFVKLKWNISWGVYFWHLYIYWARCRREELLIFHVLTLVLTLVVWYFRWSVTVLHVREGKQELPVAIQVSDTHHLWISFCRTSLCGGERRCLYVSVCRNFLESIFLFVFNSPAGWDNEKKVSILYEGLTSMKHTDKFNDIIRPPLTRNVSSS